MSEKTVFDFDANLKNEQREAKALKWLNVKDGCFGLFGSDALGEEGFCRLSKEERDYIRSVNDGEAWLAEQAAGIQVRFETDSAQLFLKGRNRAPFDMTNMTQIGECGADLYVYDEEMAAYVLHDVVRIYPMNSTTYELSLGHFTDRPKKPRRYIVYLALYMAVEELSIGVDEDAAVTPSRFGCDKKIGVYGTSIVQGCCASRPGLAPTNYLSRQLDMQVYNFGFSGAAMMEKALGEVLGNREMDVLIVDAEPNAGIDGKMKENAEGFLNAFFEKKPNVPVVLFSRVLFAMDRYDEYRIKLREYYKGYLCDLAKRYRKKGYKAYFADGSKIFKGNYTEYTADGIHPSDMGMISIAAAYKREVKKALKRIKI